jgi:hypothetical protein
MPMRGAIEAPPLMVVRGPGKAETGVCYATRAATKAALRLLGRQGWSENKTTKKNRRVDAALRLASRSDALDWFCRRRIGRRRRAEGVSGR